MSAQANALGKLLMDHKANGCSILHAPFDLPDGYISVVVLREGRPELYCGISREGAVSS